MRDFWRDLRLGARQLMRRPGFSVAAVLSLALGTGLNTTLFSVVNAVLLRGTPVAEPERLVEIYTGPGVEFPQLTLSYPDYLDLRQHADTLESIAAHAYVRGVVSTGDRPALVTGETVSDNYFAVLGIPRPAVEGSWRRRTARRARRRSSSSDTASGSGSSGGVKTSSAKPSS